jgi:hypothetical protein
MHVVLGPHVMPLQPWLHDAPTHPGPASAPMPVFVPMPVPALPPSSQDPPVAHVLGAHAPPPAHVEAPVASDPPSPFGSEPATPDRPDGPAPDELLPAVASIAEVVSSPASAVIRDGGGPRHAAAPAPNAIINARV